jgi:hypothetical protein
MERIEVAIAISKPRVLLTGSLDGCCGGVFEALDGYFVSWDAEHKE